MSEDNVSLYRDTVLRLSGYETVEDMGSAILKLIAETGAELSKSDLSPYQAHGLNQALRDTPIAYSALRGILSELLPLSKDQKANLLFALVKLMDDLISLGSLAAAKSGRQDIAFSVLEGAQKGGRRSGVTRSRKSDAWRSIAKAMALEVRKKHPSWSQDDIATEIAALWKGEKAPGHSSLKTLVADMIQRGELTKRSVNEAPSAS